MIEVGDIQTNSLMYRYPNIRGCANYENLDYDNFKRGLEKSGYFIDNDTMYTRTHQPVAVWIHDERKGIGVRYDSINQCLLREGLNFADLTRGVTSNGKKIIMVRK